MKIGQLDIFDQPLCNLAQLLKVDTLILQHEVGSNGALTEILDARPFHDAEDFQDRYSNVLKARRRAINNDIYEITNDGRILFPNQLLSHLDILYT